MIGSLAVVLNIALNAVFIFGLVGMPAMGIAGAALATVCARIFETIAVIIVVIKYKCPKLGNMLVIKDRQMHKDYWKYTTPLLVNQIGWGGGVTMYSVIMGHMGSDATAANSIASIVRTIIASLCWGISAGVSIIIGQTLGQNKLEEAKKINLSVCRSGSGQLPVL